jgi:hypothetical protein
MKISNPWSQGACLLTLSVALLSLQNVHAQVPALLWRTNVGATVFGSDAQTNVYANANGTVILLSAAGVPLQTNAICPVPSLGASFALRDSAGNFFFAGNFDGTNDFGGQTIVGGWTNLTPSHHWEPGYPTCYLAKYAPNGALLWATRIDGQLASSNAVSDLVLNPDDSVTIGIYCGQPLAQILQFSSTGTMLWQTANLSSGFNGGAVKLTSLRGTNGGFLLYRIGSPNAWGYYTSSGNFAFIPSQPLVSSSSLSKNGKPVTTPAGEIFTAGLQPVGPGLPVIQKALIGGGIMWTQAIGSVEQWILGADAGVNLYLSGTDGTFSKYTSDGVPIWATNFVSAALSLVVDTNGNRFVQFADNSFARLATEPAPVGPFFTKPPVSTTVFAGDSFNFNVTVDGTPPFYYAWQFNGTNLPGANSASLTFNSVSTAQAGPYKVVVSNAANTVTSSPAAILRVKSVEIYLGNVLLTNGTYTFTSPPVLTVRSAFPSGSAFYTTDGSAPTFSSSHYLSPITINTSTTVRAIGYSSDFLQSEEADAVNIVVLPRYTLTASSSGGGWVTLPQTGTPPSDALSLWSAEGNMLDSAGTNNGTAEGSVAYASGQVGQAFSLNGTDADVKIPAAPTLDVGAGNGMTLVTWFKPSSTSAPASLLEWFDSGYSLDHYEGVLLEINVPSNYGGSGNGSILGNLQDTSGNFHLISSPAGQFNAGAFNHTVLSYDKTSGLAKLYLNGRLVTQTNLGIFTPETRSSNFKVILGGIHSAFVGHIAEHFAGLMDETAIYGRALSDTEVSALYSATGGFITNSPSGKYFSTNVVPVVAVPAPGWQFLYWLGDALGTNPSNQISMERDKSIYAVFGTTLGTTVVGPGHLALDRGGSVYAYGTVVKVSAIPDAGSYFGSWGNAAAGSSVNPLYFAVTSPTQTISSIFGTLSANQVALTLATSGNGKVAGNPQANAFSTGQSVTLTATPDDGQIFLGWSGDAGGSQNPLTVLMDQSKYITANFSGAPTFHVHEHPEEGLSSAGFRFTLTGAPYGVYHLYGSSNLFSWQSLGLVTNDANGQCQILDTNANNAQPKYYRIQP